MAGTEVRRSHRPSGGSKGDLREQSLLASARQMLETGRFAEASVADVARAAGLARASFYFYFPSKQALLAAAINEPVAQSSASVPEVVADRSGLSPVESLTATLQAAADLWWQHRLSLIARMELNVTSPEHRQGMTDATLLREPMAALLRRHGRCHDAEDEDNAPNLVAALILMTDWSFYDIARRNAPRFEYNELTARLTIIWSRVFEVNETYCASAVRGHSANPP